MFVASNQRGGLFNSFPGPTMTKILNSLPDSDENARPAYVGEKHLPLLLPNGRFGRANYCGPGTHIVQRLKDGDPPRTAIDKVCQGHDIRYEMARNLKDTRKADEIMINKTKQLVKNKQDNRFNGVVAGKAIELKNRVEDLGILRRDMFAHKGSTMDSNLSLQDRGVSAEDAQVLQNKLESLEQQGYGKRPADKLKAKIIKGLQKEKKESFLQGMVNKLKLTDNVPKSLIHMFENKAFSKTRNPLLKNAHSVITILIRGLLEKQGVDDTRPIRKMIPEDRYKALLKAYGTRDAQAFLELIVDSVKGA